MTGAMLIPEEIGERLDGSKADAVELLLELAKANYRDRSMLSSERVNLLEAVSDAYRIDKWLDVVDYALVLDTFLDTHGYWREDIRNLELALEAAKRLGPGYKGRVALALHNLAVIYMAQGHDQQAETCFNQSLEFQRQLEDKLAISRELHYLGRIKAKAKHPKLARDFLEQSLVLGREAGDDRGVRATLHELGNLCLDQGDLAEAEGYYQQSLTDARDPDSMRDTATTMYQLGILNHRRGKLEDALGYFNNSLQMRYQVGHLEGIAYSLYSLGNLAFENKLLDQAKLHWQESLRIFESLGMPMAETVRSKLSTLMI